MRMIFLYGLIVAVVIVLLWLWTTYNKLIKLKLRADEAWSDIDVQLKRRYDLIPNLMNSVKGYMQHESGTLEAVVKARQQAVSTNESKNHSLKEQIQAENILSGALRQLFALSESYPDLKANQNFLQLQDELSDTENKIQASRRFYNGNVRDFNISIQQFPTNTIANAFNFKNFEFFEVDDAKERKNVEVKF